MNFDFNLPGRTKRLLDFFGIGIKTSNKSQKGIFLDTKKINNKIPISNDIYGHTQRALEKWSQNSSIDPQKRQSRIDMLRDLDEMYYNSPIIAKAITITRDEVIQADSNKIEFLKRVNDELSRNIFFEKHEIKVVLEELSKMENE